MSQVDYTYSNDASGVRSIIDHSFLSENLIPNVTHYSSMHDGDNLSDHCPIKLHVSLLMTNVLNPHNSRPPSSAKKRSWPRATDDNIRDYKRTLRQLLSLIPVPYAALQSSTDPIPYKQAVFDYHDSIIEACIMAAEATIPRMRKRGRAG